MTNAERLRAMMRENGFTNADIAQLAGVVEKTVESWLATPGSASHRQMADRHLRVIGVMLPGFLAARGRK